MTISHHVETFNVYKERFDLHGDGCDFSYAIRSAALASKLYWNGNEWKFYIALQSKFGVTQQTIRFWERRPLNLLLSNTLKTKVLDWCSSYIKLLQ